MVIHKYILNGHAINEPQTIRMPKGAKLLDIQFQDYQPVVWAEVNHEAKLEKPSHYYRKDSSLLYEMRRWSMD